jgi:hypothetical protein
VCATIRNLRDVATSALVAEVLRRIGADSGTVHVHVEAVDGAVRRVRREFLTPGSALDDRFPALPPP